MAARWGWPSTWQIDKVCGSEYARYRWYRYGIRDESGNADVGADMADMAGERWERNRRRDRHTMARLHAVRDVAAILAERTGEWDVRDVAVLAHYVATGEVLPHPAVEALRLAGDAAEDVPVEAPDVMTMRGELHHDGGPGAGVDRDERLVQALIGAIGGREFVNGPTEEAAVKRHVIDALRDCLRARRIEDW